MNAMKFRRRIGRKARGGRADDPSAETSPEAATAEKTFQKTLEPIGPLLAECVRRMQYFHDLDSPDHVTGVPTGFAEIDRLTRGLQPGELILIAGCPLMGKTAFALNIATNVAIKSELPVAYFSLQLGGVDLAMRMLLATGDLDVHEGSAGILSDDAWGQLSCTLAQLDQAPIHVDETYGISTGELCRKARQHHQRSGMLGLIVIDCIQLIDASRLGNGQDATPSQTLQEIKALARELNVPIVVISELLTRVENLWNRRPTLLDLRESGIGRNDVDVVMFLFREELYDQDESVRGMAECIIAKQKHGPAETVKLSFLKKSVRFESLD